MVASTIPYRNIVLNLFQGFACGNTLFKVVFGSKRCRSRFIYVLFRECNDPHLRSRLGRQDCRGSGLPGLRDASLSRGLAYVGRIYAPVRTTIHQMQGDSAVEGAWKCPAASINLRRCTDTRPTFIGSLGREIAFHTFACFFVLEFFTVVRYGPSRNAAIVNWIEFFSLLSAVISLSNYFQITLFSTINHKEFDIGTWFDSISPCIFDRRHPSQRQKTP